jgi:uncharacterized protein (TIGR00255 family)
MTGFGKATSPMTSKKITVELKSLNSKQFDLNSRITPIYRSLELEMRNIIAARLERGKVDLTVSIEYFGEDAPTHLNISMLHAYHRQVQEASRALGIPEPSDWYSVLLRFPDTMKTDTDADLDDNELDTLKETLNNAIDALMNYRRVEGRKLEEFFTVRIDRIKSLLAEVPKFEVERTEKIKQRLADGLSKISVIEYDKGRLEQEMIFYIEKLDVNEEKQRLAQHLDYFMETMALPTPGQGKKLGFIAQEMGREINTLGSKSNQADMQRIVVMMKDELEQIKEQVLNVM